MTISQKMAKDDMNTYFVTYYIRNRNLYDFKIVHAHTASSAIKKARVKHIVDIKEIKGEKQ